VSSPDAMATSSVIPRASSWAPGCAYIHVGRGSVGSHAATCIHVQSAVCTPYSCSCSCAHELTDSLAGWRRHTYRCGTPTCLAFSGDALRDGSEISMNTNENSPPVIGSGHVGDAHTQRSSSTHS
jgi:hypothetical protein